MGMKKTIERGFLFAVCGLLPVASMATLNTFTNNEANVSVRTKLNAAILQTNTNTANIAASSNALVSAYAAADTSTSNALAAAISAAAMSAVQAGTTGTKSLALSEQADASGAFSLAVGGIASATENYSTAVGYNAKASGEYSTALGYLSVATATRAFQLGSGSNANINTLQFRSYQLLDATGNIPVARLSSAGDGRYTLKSAGMSITNSWVDAASITNQQTFISGQLTAWTTNGVSL
jgi:hypothetical protein